MTPEQQEAAAQMAYESHTGDAWAALPNKYIWLDLITMVDRGLGNDPQNGAEVAALKAYQSVIALAPGSVDLGPVLVAGELSGRPEEDPTMIGRGGRRLERSEHRPTGISPYREETEEAAPKKSGKSK